MSIFGGAVHDLEEFTPEQKLQIVLKAEELLDGGNRWIKGAWIRKTPSKNGGKPVDCYCLDGACAVAMVELGFLPKIADWRKRLSMVAAGCKVSIAAVVERLHGNSIAGFNDFHETEWKDVDFVLQRRKQQLRAQIARQKRKGG